MEEQRIRVYSQEQLDAVPYGEKAQDVIEIRFGTTKASPARVNRPGDHSTFAVYGDVCVEVCSIADGRCRVRACNCTVRASGRSRVSLYGRAIAEAYDDSVIVAHSFSTVLANDRCRTEARENSVVKAADGATVRASGQSRILADRNAKAEVSDDAEVFTLR